jgi:aryl-alcohol dehydrogenase-like predicted oxidoreductase
MKRRDSVAGGAETGAASSLFPAGLDGVDRKTHQSGLERRALGRTGESLSMVGFGGVVVDDVSSEEAARSVAWAIDAGINYFDVAPTYGNAEDMLGPALEPYREGVFLACKTQERTREGALAELDRSLKKMRTDRFDLYQHHAVTSAADVETILGPGGAMEGFEAARKAGKVRFLGFSAHSVEAALALMDGCAFDSILFPVNFATWNAGQFGPQVLAQASARGMGILCLKALAKGPWPEGADKRKRYDKCWYEPLDQPTEAGLALRFTLSHAVTAAVAPGDPGLFRMAVELAKGFTPVTPEEEAALKAKAATGTPLFRYPSPAA